MSHAIDSALRARLAAPFAISDVCWKVHTVQGARCHVVPYVRPRAVMDRLDDIFTVSGWGTTHRQLPTGVVCQLQVTVGEECITHEDMTWCGKKGSDIETAYAVSLSRVAMRLGIGRYLCQFDNVWVDCDAKTGQPLQMPILPALVAMAESAIEQIGSAAPTPEPATTAPPTAVEPIAIASVATEPVQPEIPQTGQALFKLMQKAGEKFVKEGISKHPDDFWIYVQGQMAKAKMPSEFLKWTPEQCVQAFTFGQGYRKAAAQSHIPAEPRTATRKPSPASLKAINAIAVKLDMTTDGLVEYAREHNLITERESLDQLTADAAHDLEVMLKRRSEEQTADDSLPENWTKPAQTFASAEGA